MNLAESMKHVLGSKENVFKTFWKRDLKLFLKTLNPDWKNLPKHFTKENLRTSFHDFRSSALDSATILILVPGRIKKGFHYFREDLLRELELLEDSKHRTVFCLKVVGALTSFSLGALYNVRKARPDIPLQGLRRSNAFTKYLVSELIYQVSQLFILRFLTEVEHHMTHEEDLKNLRYFKTLVAESRTDDPSLVSEDHAIHIVESLRTYILTGERV